MDGGEHDLLVRGIGHLVVRARTVPPDPDGPPGAPPTGTLTETVEIPDAWLAVDAGRVAAHGRAGTEPPARAVIDAGGRLVTPGLVNTHHHLYQNLTRAHGPTATSSLFGWLAGLYPLWARLDADAVEVSTAVGLLELALGGATTSSDHLYVHPVPHLVDAQVRGARRAGLRFVTTRGSMSLSVEDGGLPPASVVQDEETILADSERVVAAFHDPSPGSMLRVALAPCSPFSVDDHLMRSTADLAQRLDVRLHTHLAEDADEDEYSRERYGTTTVEHLEDVGWAGPRTWVAHLVRPSPAEVVRLARAGVAATHCPSSNMVLGSGAARVQEYRGAGMAVGLGCDGSSSSDHGSLWLEARTAVLLARLVGGAGAMGARDALAMATTGSAAALGWDDEIGALDVGYLADLVVWDADPLALAGALDDPVEAWVRCGPQRAWATLVGGREVVRDGRVVDSSDSGAAGGPADLSDLLAAHRAAAERLRRG